MNTSLPPLASPSIMAKPNPLEVTSRVARSRSGGAARVKCRPFLSSFCRSVSRIRVLRSSGSWRGTSCRAARISVAVSDSARSAKSARTRVSSEVSVRLPPARAGDRCWCFFPAVSPRRRVLRVILLLLLVWIRHFFWPPAARRMGALYPLGGRAETKNPLSAPPGPAGARAGAAAGPCYREFFLVRGHRSAIEWCFRAGRDSGPSRHSARNAGAGNDRGPQGRCSTLNSISTATAR